MAHTKPRNRRKRASQAFPPRQRPMAIPFPCLVCGEYRGAPLVEVMAMGYYGEQHGGGVPVGVCPECLAAGTGVACTTREGLIGVMGPEVYSEPVCQDDGAGLRYVFRLVKTIPLADVCMEYALDRPETWICKGCPDCVDMRKQRAQP